MSKSTHTDPTLAMRVVFQPGQIAKALTRANGRPADPADVIRLGRQVVMARTADKALSAALGALRDETGEPGLSLLGTVEIVGEYEIGREPTPLTADQKAKAEAAKAKRNGGKGKAKPLPKAERIRKGKAKAKRHQEAEQATIPVETFEAVESGDTAHAA